MTPGPIDACPGCGGIVADSLAEIRAGGPDADPWPGDFDPRLRGYRQTIACLRCGARLDMDCLFAEYPTMYHAFHASAMRFAGVARGVAGRRRPAPEPMTDHPTTTDPPIGRDAARRLHREEPSDMSRVIDAWNAVFRDTLATEQEAHLVEHLLESEGWKRMSAWFDDIETNIHVDIIHKLIKRVNRLRDRVTPMYAFPPQCYGHMEIEQALASMLGHLKDIRGMAGTGGSPSTGLVAVCNAAESSDDYASERLAWKMIKWLEGRIAKYENRLDKLRSLGLQPFLAEMMD